MERSVKVLLCRNTRETCKLFSLKGGIEGICKLLNVKRRTSIKCPVKVTLYLLFKKESNSFLCVRLCFFIWLQQLQAEWSTIESVRQTVQQGEPQPTSAPPSSLLELHSHTLISKTPTTDLEWELGGCRNAAVSFLTGHVAAAGFLSVNCDKDHRRISWASFSDPLITLFYTHILSLRINTEPVLIQYHPIMIHFRLHKSLISIISL